jgi:hypothetical protein
MSEPSSGVPSEIADAEVEAPTNDEPTTVELEVDQEKVEAWDEVKGDYQVEPGGRPVPNSMDTTGLTGDDDDDQGDGGDQDDDDKDDDDTA